MTRLNAATERHGGRPLRHIQAPTIRPSRDLGMLAGELVRGQAGALERSSFR